MYTPGLTSSRPNRFKTLTKTIMVNNKNHNTRRKRSNRNNRNSNRQQPRPARQRRIGNRAPHALTVGVHSLSACGAHYAQALLHPFSLQKPACIPDLHSIPSKKIKVVTRLTFSTGSNGSGYIIYNPQDKCSDLSVLSSVVITDANYTGTATTPIATSGTGISAVNEAKIPYTSGQFEANASSPGIQGRVVGCAMRIRYRGTELNRGGSMSGLRHPDNETLVGFTTEQMRQYETCAIEDITRDWTTINYRPVTPGEFEYSPYPVGDANSPGGGNGVQNFSLCFRIDGTTTTTGTGPQTFDVELVKFLEYIGNVDNITKTHTDLQSMSLIRNALPQKSVHKKPAHSLYKGIVQVGKEAMKTLPGHMASNLLKESASAESAGFLSGIADKAFTWAGEALGDIMGSGLGSALAGVAALL